MAAVRLRQDLGLTAALAARFVPVLVGSGAFLLLRRKIRIPREAWPKVIAMGLLSVPAYNVFFFHGMKTVPSGTGALIIALNPVFTAVLARVVLGEPFGRRHVAGLLLALAGLFVVVRFGTDKAVDWPYLSSALLLALAPLSWAIYAVIGRTLPAGADPIDTSYALLFVGSLPLLVFARPSTVTALLASPGSARRGPLPRDPLHAPCVGLVPLGPQAAPRGRGGVVHLPEPAPGEPLGLALRGARLRLPFLLGAAILLAGVALIVLPGFRRRNLSAMMMTTTPRPAPAAAQRFALLSIAAADRHHRHEDGGVEAHRLRRPPLRRRRVAREPPRGARRALGPARRGRSRPTPSTTSATRRPSTSRRLSRGSPSSGPRSRSRSPPGSGSPTRSRSRTSGSASRSRSARRRSTAGSRSSSSAPGRRLDSITLRSDAHHLMTDVWTSGGVLVGILVVKLTGWLILDPIVALAVATNIVWMAGKILLETAQGLLDRTIPEGEQRPARGVLARYRTDGVDVHAVQDAAGGTGPLHRHARPRSRELERAARPRPLRGDRARGEALFPRASVLTHLEPIEDPAAWEHARATSPRRSPGHSPGRLETSPSPERGTPRRKWGGGAGGRRLPGCRSEGAPGARWPGSGSASRVWTSCGQLGFVGLVPVGNRYRVLLHPCALLVPGSPFDSSRRPVLQAGAGCRGSSPALVSSASRRPKLATIPPTRRPFTHSAGGPSRSGSAPRATSSE